jgi:hypothetical protein
MRVKKKTIDNINLNDSEKREKRLYDLINKAKAKGTINSVPKK